MKKPFTTLAMAMGTSAVLLTTAATAQQTEIPGYDDAVAAAADSDWATDESIRGGLHLVAQFDSSGDIAWDVEKHPLIYVTSESHQNPNPDRTLEGSFAGFHLIDGYSKEVIAQKIVSHHPEGNAITRGPHGTIISPDGKWAYVGWSEQDRTATRGSGYVAVVNMQTLKVDKIMRQESMYRGAPRSQEVHHFQACETPEGQQRVFVQFGFGASGGPHFILDPGADNSVERAITYDDIQQMGHPFITASRDCKTAFVSIGSPELRHAYAPGGGIAKMDIDSGIVTNVMGTGYHPIGITHTHDDAFTFVVDGHGSFVYKIDNAANRVVGWTSAGVAGPYGIALNWDESLAFTVGKGEGTHNVGQSLGILDADRITPYRGKHQMPIILGGSASSVDHNILHPDPEVNEMWVSNMNGWETMVVDLNTLEVKDYIATPNGGDTHSGGFVRYDADWNGELLVDQGGPKGATMLAKVKAITEARLGTGEEVVYTAEQIEEGRVIFQETAGGVGCASCHGPDANGMSAPGIQGADFALVDEALGRVLQMEFIRDEISQEDRQAIAAYLSTFSH